MWRCLALLLLWPVPALAQDAVDFKLAINGVGIAMQQLTRAAGTFVETCSQTAALAHYWQDACQSTPACGGTNDDKH